MKQKLINYLLKKLIRNDFTDVDDMERLRTYQKMKDLQIVKLFKARYTNNILAHLIAEGDEKKQMKGRVLEDLDILNSIESVDNNLLRINEHLEKQKSKRSMLENLKNKLIKQ